MGTLARIILSNFPIRRQGIGAWQDDEGQGTYFETKAVLTERKEKLFPHENCYVMERAA